MASYQMGDLKKGLKIEIDGIPFKIVEYQHVKPGKGPAFVRVKIKSFIDGKVLEKTFHAGDKCDAPNLEEKQMQYLYDDGDNLVFMNSETYDQFEIPADMMGESALYLQDNMAVTVNFIEGKPVSVNLPPHVVLTVTQTEPAIKNQTATNSYKPALLSNGIRTTIPPFVNEGEAIVVSTTDGSYVERAK